MSRYIFDEENIEYNFDYNLLEKIENNLIDGITYNEAIYLLRWIVFVIEENLDLSDPTYTGYCGISSCIAVRLLRKLGLKCFSFNLKNLLNENHNIHSIVLAKIKVIENNEIHNKEFIIDPTFRQYCIIERCLRSRILKYENTEYKVAPFPGYFLSLTDDGIKFGTLLLNNGFFELNAENFKLYCDAFQLYKNEQNNCFPIYNIRNGKEYISEIKKCKEKIYYYKNDLDLKLPSEINNQKLLIKK